MPSSHPSVAEVDAVTQIADPVLRNLRITVAYGRLANAFAQSVPGGANWCTFATWASKQAGRTIRKEDIARAAERHFRSRLDKRPLGRQLARLPGLSTDVLVRLVGQLSLALPGIDRAAGAVARGNRKVFEEIGHYFAHALDSLDQHPGSFETVAASLRPGPPPDGQDLLRRAFLNYQIGSATADPAVRAQSALLANVQIGFHEQTRLQPEIREAMDAALLDVAEVRHEVLERLAAHAPAALRSGLLTDAVNALVDDFAQEVRSVVRVATTELMMTIGLPRGRTLRLGADLTQRFPLTLKTLTNVELVALMAGFDPTLDSTQGSGAIDWAVLQQRMRFIADFFRSSHDDDSLHEAPFPRAALEAIAAGGMPDLTGVA
jgi:hypothetical protein